MGLPPRTQIPPVIDGLAVGAVQSPDSHSGRSSSNLDHDLLEGNFQCFDLLNSAPHRAYLMHALIWCVDPVEPIERKVPCPHLRSPGSARDARSHEPPRCALTPARFFASSSPAPTK